MANSSIGIQPARYRGTAVGRVILAAAFFAMGQGAFAQQGDAKAVLKAMTDYVSNRKTIELRFDSAIEVITPQLEKIQFTNSGEILLSRPDKLRAHRVGGYSDVEMVFDGETVSIFGKGIDGYAQFDGPGSVDQLIEVLRAGRGVALPGADLLLSNSYDALFASRNGRRASSWHRTPSPSPLPPGRRSSVPTRSSSWMSCRWPRRLEEAGETAQVQIRAHARLGCRRVLVQWGIGPTYSGFPMATA